MPELFFLTAIAVAKKSSGRGSCHSSSAPGYSRRDVRHITKSLVLIISDNSMLKVWAPTVQDLSLKIYNKEKTLKETVEMTKRKKVFGRLQ